MIRQGYCIHWQGRCSLPGWFLWSCAMRVPLHVSIRLRVEANAEKIVMVLSTYHAPLKKIEAQDSEDSTTFMLTVRCSTSPHSRLHSNPGLSLFTSRTEFKISCFHNNKSRG